MYPILPIPDDAPIILEQLGTKRKFWFDNYKSLFKETRANTGEDWSEKIVCEICSLIGLPHAHYDLAVWKEKRGVVTQNFAQREDGKRLILGNELLYKFDPKYPVKEVRGVRQHTIRKALAVASLSFVKPPLGFEPVQGIDTAADVFVGYLMLDALVANQDRHHENWGLVLSAPDNAIHLAPSFDHASSLGPFELDAVRAERLSTKDKARSLERYVEKGTSAFYSTEASSKPLSTLEAFMAAARIRPKAALVWLKRLGDVSLGQIENVFAKLAPHLLSDTSRRFALRIITLNRDRLLTTVRALLA